MKRIIRPSDITSGPVRLIGGFAIRAIVLVVSCTGHDVDRIEMGCVGMMRMQWGESARAVLPPYYALLAVIKPCDRSCASKKEKKKVN
jgi:hypothetical protein